MIYAERYEKGVQLQTIRYVAKKYSVVAYGVLVTKAGSLDVSGISYDEGTGTLTSLPSGVASLMSTKDIIHNAGSYVKKVSVSSGTVKYCGYVVYRDAEGNIGVDFSAIGSFKIS